MEDIRFSYKPEYLNSRALIIGIDEYKSASPLNFAVNDAKELSSLLIDEFSFEEENVSFLINQQATKENIFKAFMAYTSDDIDENERILIFFAGHGFTSIGARGEVGFLVPYDADMKDLSSLTRWDDLTKNSELIPAKHMFFIMDACYGGLAITRSLKPGSARFLKDMLLRYSRQVLTAGKADEIVSDSGGPIPNHSVFTGHLIEALKGNAANDQGIITANAVMAYVYEKVANDRDSYQTPHYGYFDGDGDFIFKFPALKDLTKDDKKDIDELIIVPSSSEDSNKNDAEDKIATVKRLLADSTASIALHDFVTLEIQRFLSLSSEDNFAVQGVAFSPEELLERLSKYELMIRDLAGITACVAYWAKPDHKLILQKLVTRVTDRLDSNAGLVIWLNLRWYPIIVQLYCAGVAAVAGRRYDSLANIFYTDTGGSDYDSSTSGLLIDSISEAISELGGKEVFKNVPGHERHYVPMSEYLYKLIQPTLDDILFIGRNYEASFDEFEVLLGLAIADQRVQSKRRVWGPIGRFGWKQVHRDNAPLNRIIRSARSKGESWAPLKQGLFGGDYERFISVAEEYQKRVSSLQWF